MQRLRKLRREPTASAVSGATVLSGMQSTRTAGADQRAGVRGDAGINAQGARDQREGSACAEEQQGARAQLGLWLRREDRQERDGAGEGWIEDVSEQEAVDD